MKTIRLILATLLTSTVSFAQDDATSDAVLFSYLVGTWEHVSSTFPDGDVTTYQRKFHLYADGKGTCAKYTDLDTIYVHFEWEVKDSIISLFEIDKRGKRIYADSQTISFVDLNKMHLTDAYCEENRGKICCYKRTGNEIAKY